MGGTGVVGFSLINIFKALKIKSYLSYRCEEGKNYLENFPHLVPVDILSLPSLKDKIQVIDLVGGDLALNIIKLLGTQMIQFITVPTYSFDRIRNACDERDIPNASFIVKSNTQQINDLLQIVRTTKLKYDNFNIFKLSDVSDVFEKYGRGEIKGRIIFEP